MKTRHKQTVAVILLCSLFFIFLGSNVAPSHMISFASGQSSAATLADGDTLSPSLDLLMNSITRSSQTLKSLSEKSNRFAYRLLLSIIVEMFSFSSLLYTLSILILCGVISSTLHMIRYIHRTDGKIRPRILFL